MQEIYGNTPTDWALAFVVFALAAIGLRMVARLAQRRLASFARRTSTDVDDLANELLRRTKMLSIFLVALWLASQGLVLSGGLERGIDTVLIVGVLLQGAFWGSAAVTYLLRRYQRRQLEVDPGGATAAGALAFMARLVVWALFILLILENLGVDVTALITGLGIGGIAVALALQNVLSDLFASLSIVMDKPFVIGDFIIVGEHAGSVEHVGLKSTRVRSLSGEQLVFANSDLLSSRIRNYKLMNERRIAFEMGLVYDTPLARLEQIPGMIREAVEGQANTRFDRAHFVAFGPSSLDFETVYFMLVPDYNTYMDTQQAINLEIVRRFDEAGVEFAFPTRTVLVRGEGASERVGVAPPARSG